MIQSVSCNHIQQKCVSLAARGVAGASKQAALLLRADANVFLPIKCCVEMRLETLKCS